MKQVRTRIIISVLALFLWGSAGQAQSAPVSFVSFDEFLEGVSLAAFDSSAVWEETGVRDPAEFQRMRQHVLSLYEGVDVPHSFVMDGQYFDCVPVAQQPSVRALGRDKLVLEPPLPAESEAPTRSAARRLPSPLTLGLVDSFGNAIHCDEGTIPMRRVTLEEMSRFGTLQGFFRKTPDDGVTKAQATHKYAHAYQYVKNYGGNSWLNVWSPPINQKAGQIFSLSQHWYSGGSGKKLQTVEGGWQAYPAKYSTPKSVLFIYWTADAYNTTGCYNLDCTAFVQTNNNWHLGGTWLNYSTKGGTQWEFQMQWKLTGGNWWLFLQGSGGYEAVGYYPGSIFKGGQLSKYATAIDYGGETVGTTSWPQMGSGAQAKQGTNQAAYQRLIFYLNGSATTDSKWGSLKAVQESPKCYTLKLTPSSSGSSWATFFYFGGPGGKSC